MLELSKILTEEERSGISPDILTKLESACRADIDRAKREESDRNNARFESLMQTVGKAVDEKVRQAVSQGMDKMKTDAINSKLYEAVAQITSIVEGIGIPATEESKKLSQRLDQVDAQLQNIYAERQDLKKQLNYQAKLNRIYELTKGCTPDTVNAVIEEFKNKDIREIDKNAIADFIDGNGAGDGLTTSVDVDIKPVPEGGRASEGLIDKVELALSEIKDNGEMEMPGFLAMDNDEGQRTAGRRKPLGESIRRPFRPERVRIPATGSAMASTPEAPVAPDVRAAMAQIEAFTELGFGRFQ